MVELTVILKDSDSTFRHKFLVYEEFSVIDSDLVISGYVDQAKSLFKGEPDSIQIKISMEYQ